MISPLAQIHPGARIAENVRVDAFSVIEDNVTIGEGTHVMPNVTIFSGTTIGKGCIIFPGAVLGAIPQDLKFVGEETTVEIGDNTTIRECVTINRGTKDRWKTKVGSNCLLMAYVHIAHDCFVGNHVILANAVQLAGHVTIDDYAILGGLSGVHQFIHIGAHVYIAGQILIRKDVPPYVRAARDPLAYVGINNVGLTRRGYAKEVIDEISAIYHILFVQGHTTSKAIEIINETLADTEVKRDIIGFVENSKAGIIKRSVKSGLDDY
ncbi:acyl-ACP--UDP-N-acetylglucosamine O-acyltransferase [Aridibaculum aurantiacum]|uniref:acyl-ACP--UDP-N-acetylglucosamine O-acyltransferase n=1 Tax=Aridibaculum aurantiacum TaxID=2810307 RepID=UPI001A9597CD|nr:acyl-ACP--UDP-N-acetylglucosamine O-acyltransferase [Aridibaculum aurantiacum]